LVDAGIWAASENTEQADLNFKIAETIDLLAMREDYGLWENES
jgi:hypothetical protein